MQGFICRVVHRSPPVSQSDDWESGLSPKLFRVVTDLLEYNFKMEWTPGKRHLFVDLLGRVPQMELFEDYDPLTGGEENEWENGGRYGSHQNCNNVTHLDTALGLQVTASVMAAVREDPVYQRVLQEVGVRSKRG